jgi:hypothetical protein
VIRALAVLVLLGVAASPARADELADAKARFRRGVELYRERRWKEAMEEFEAAYRAKPHGALHFNVAQCRERLDDWPGALRGYHDYLREVPDASDRDAVRRAMQRLEERLAKAGVQVLLLDSSPPGARVLVEALERGRTPLHVVVAPGPYALALELEGHAPWSGQVEVTPTASVAVAVALTPAPAPDLAARPPAGAQAERMPAPAPPPARGRRYLPAWIAAGTAALALAAGIAYGASARADARAIDALSSPDGAVASRRAVDARSKARASDALFGLAGGAAAAGATLFVLESRF